MFNKEMHKIVKSECEKHGFNLKKKSVKINNKTVYKITDKDTGKIILDNCSINSAFTFLTE